MAADRSTMMSGLSESTTQLLPEYPPCGELLVSATNLQYGSALYLVRMDGRPYRQISTTDISNNDIDTVGHRLCIVNTMLINGKACANFNEIYMCVHNQNIVVAWYAISSSTFWLRMTHITLHPSERFIHVFYERARGPRIDAFGHNDTPTCSIAMIDDIVMVIESGGANVFVINIKSGEEIVTDFKTKVDNGTLPHKVVAIAPKRLFLLLLHGQLFSYDICTNTFQNRLLGTTINTLEKDGTIEWVSGSELVRKTAPTLASRTENKELVFRAKFGSSDVNEGGWISEIYCYNKTDDYHLAGILDGNIFVYAQQTSKILIDRKLDNNVVGFIPYADDNCDGLPVWSKPIRESRTFTGLCIELLQLIEDTHINFGKYKPANRANALRRFPPLQTQYQLSMDDNSHIVAGQFSEFNKDTRDFKYPLTRYNKCEYDKSSQDRARDWKWTVASIRPIQQQFYIAPLHTALTSRFSPLFPFAFPAVLITVILEYAIV